MLRPLTGVHWWLSPSHWCSQCPFPSHQCVPAGFHLPFVWAGGLPLLTVVHSGLLPLTGVRRWAFPSHWCVPLVFHLSLVCSSAFPPLTRVCWCPSLTPVCTGAIPCLRGLCWCPSASHRCARTSPSYLCVLVAFRTHRCAPVAFPHSPMCANVLPSLTICAGDLPLLTSVYHWPFPLMGVRQCPSASHWCALMSFPFSPRVLVTFPNSPMCACGLPSH